MKVTPRQYAKLILEVTDNLEKEEDLTVAIKKIAETIKENRNQGKLKQITAEFDRMYKEKQGIIDAQVISAHELTKDQLTVIKKALAKKYNTTEDKINFDNIIKPEIKGGLIIKVGDEVMDGSVKSKLERLKSSLNY